MALAPGGDGLHARQAAQVEVEQQHFQITLALGDGEAFVAIAGRQHRHRFGQRLHHVAHRLADQGVVVDDKQFYASSLLSVGEPVHCDWQSLGVGFFGQGLL